MRPWPGNVRELRGAVSHAAKEVLAADRDLVRVEDLGASAGESVTTEVETAAERPKPLAGDLDKATIIAALADAKGKVSTAARILGLHRTQLYRLMDKHGLARDDT